MSTKNIQLHPKQREAFNALRTKGVHTVVYGGGLGGSKSYTGCLWVLTSALQYPDTRYLIGRRRLSDLRNSTAVTLRKVASDMGILDELTTGWNLSTNTITLSNGSTIILRQLEVSAGDEELIELGSIELTGAFVDEAGEVSQVAYRTLIQRLRWKLPPHGGKVLLCANPTKNWIYRDVYIPWENDTLSDHTRYIQALPKDNPFLDQSYLATLTPEVMGRELYEARVLGNWHVSPSDDMLVRDDEIVDCFTFSDEGVDKSGRYLTWDPAYGGDDRSVVMIWRGLILEHVYQWEKMDAMDQIAEVKRLIQEHQIPARHVAIDGIGSAALVAHFRGAIDIRANARPIDKQGFTSLKDQLYYRLGQAIRQKEIRFKPIEIRDKMIEEISAHRTYRTDTDQPARVTPKPDVKRAIGRSPDLSDCAAYRMYWLLSPRTMTVRFTQW